MYLLYIIEIDSYLLVNNESFNHDISNFVNKSSYNIQLNKDKSSKNTEIINNGKIIEEDKNNINHNNIDKSFANSSSLQIFNTDIFYNKSS